jgi:hydrogenase maturation protein HypF
MVQGDSRDVDDFVHQIPLALPPLAQIVRMTHEDLEVDDDERDFVIVDSTFEQRIQNSIPIDARICRACQLELVDPANRRFRYPFITCVDCGPRYTILVAPPFDRMNTTMRYFEMCEQCRFEYEDPNDRRFHAQTISCWECGPSLELRINGHSVVGDQALSQCIQVLHDGGIVGLKGIGGFQLLARADSEATVRRLRELKRRDAKPLAVMVHNQTMARDLALVDEESGRALDSVEGPIVLVRRLVSSRVAPNVAPDSRLLGLILPTTGLHQLIAEGVAEPLVCTSANISDETILSEGMELEVSLMVDAVLTHNRRIERHADDSVGRVINKQFSLIRRARGFAPRPIWLNEDGPTVLAVGAELKNTISLVSGRQSFTSVHVGDLGSLPSRTAFLKIIEDAIAVNASQPNLVVCDMHPGYASTRYATEQQVAPVLQVQHHHAHVASCIAEHQVQESVLGVACDGLGWGPDGTAWGGEFLLVDGLAVRRLGHLRKFVLPGGAAAIREPWRMAVALLADAGIPSRATQFFSRSRDQVRSVEALVEAQGQLRTSSTGRLFEGLAAIVLRRELNRYEGQLASALEQLCSDDDVEFDYAIDEGTRIQIDFRSLVRDVVDALSKGTASGKVAAGIHNTFAAALADTVLHISRRCEFADVALTGGVFQNARLVTLVEHRLRSAGFSVIRHHQVPTNDGGISLGQAHLGRLALESGRPIISAIHSEW